MARRLSTVVIFLLIPWRALAAGLLVALAFPPWNLLPFALLGVALLFRALCRRPEFGAGFLFGVGLLAPLMPWLSAFHPLAPFGVVLVSAVPYGLAARAGATPGRFAAAFAAAEFARSVGVFALPWGVLGVLAAETPWRGLAAWGGPWILSGLLWLAGALLVRRPALAVLLLCVALVPARLALPATDGPRLPVAVVQGHFAMEDDDEFRPGEVRAYLAAATREAASRGARLIAWSETVILEYLNLPGSGVAWIQALADETGAALLVGAPSFVAEDDKRNSAFLFLPRLPGTAPADGASPRAHRYDKVHLVPFGEYLPGFGPDEEHLLLPEGTGDFSPAAHARPIRAGSSILPLSSVAIGALICYEGALPALGRAQALAGSELLVTMANDAWTRSAAEAEQHAQLAMLRAVESGRPLLRAGNVGRSYILEADGTVVAERGPGYRGVVEGTVGMASESTLYMRFGDWFGWLVLLGTPYLLTVWRGRRDHGHETC